MDWRGDCIRTLLSDSGSILGVSLNLMGASSYLYYNCTHHTHAPCYSPCWGIVGLSEGLCGLHRKEALEFSSFMFHRRSVTKAPQPIVSYAHLLTVYTCHPLSVPFFPASYLVVRYLDGKAESLEFPGASQYPCFLLRTLLGGPQ